MSARAGPPIEADIRSAFGRTIRELRERAELTQEAMADLAELSVSHVSLLERGQRTATLYSAARIAYVLGLSLAELLVRAESSSGVRRPAT